MTELEAEAGESTERTFVVQVVNPERKYALAGELPPHVRVMTETLSMETELPDDLIIRLDLDFVSYGHMERLLDVGIAALERRHQELQELVADIKANEKRPPAPLTTDDIVRARDNAFSEIIRAKALVRLVKQRK